MRRVLITPTKHTHTILVEKKKSEKNARRRKRSPICGNVARGNLSFVLFDWNQSRSILTTREEFFRRRMHAPKKNKSPCSAPTFILYAEVCQFATCTRYAGIARFLQPSPKIPKGTNFYITLPPPPFLPAKQQQLSPTKTPAFKTKSTLKLLHDERESSPSPATRHVNHPRT